MGKLKNSATMTTFKVVRLVKKRNLLSITYKNVIEARRALWRIISSIK
jgi:hypothetical protein